LKKLLFCTSKNLRIIILLTTTMKLLSLVWVLIYINVTIAQTCRNYQGFPNSCLDILKGGVHSNGYYQIAGVNGETWNVYCDFESERGSAWTLVMSWSLANTGAPAFRFKSFAENAPVNEQTPNWAIYRMSTHQMNFLKKKSTHWRATCSFDQIDFDYRDYMRANFIDFDITTFEGGPKCKKVEYINVRGHVGHQTAAFFQSKNGHFLHHDSSVDAHCLFNARAGSKRSEDNFGYYYYRNDAFRCTASPTATTQYWFGSYL